MNRNILITGATGGLGSLATKTFAAQGHHLALLDRNQDRLDDLARDLNLPSERLYIQAIDLLNGPAVLDSAEAVRSKLGSVHALFHLVGGWTGGKTFAEASTDDLEFMINQHIRTTFNLFKAYSTQLASNNWGRVIIVSASTVTNPPGNSGAYTATKAAEENMALSLAAELKGTGTTVNIIQIHSIDVNNSGKGTTPAEIVSTMQYLFSEEANKINGARIPLY